MTMPNAASVAILQPETDFDASNLKGSAPPALNPKQAGKKRLMKSDLVRIGFIFPLMIILTLFPPALAEAKWSLTPRIYLEEQYDDNIFLTETNEEDDFITTVSPGVNLKYETPTEIIDLDYEFQRSFYSDFSELDFSGHRGRAEARKDFGPRFSAGIREIFIMSEDPIELTGIRLFQRPSIRIGRRNRYTRNIVEPEVTFTFHENRSIRLGYRNNILRNKAEDIADQDENAINALLTFRFNIHNGVEVFYEHIAQDYDPTVPPEPPRDLDGDEIRGRYTYYFDPKTSAFVEYRYYQRDFDRETTGFVDYKVHTPSLGFSREIRENISLLARGGYTLRDAKNRDDEEAFSGRGDLLARYKHLTVDLYGETGFDEDFTSVENLGFNEFWRVGFNGRYQLLERLWTEGFFYLESDRFVDLNRKDKLWNVRGRLNYQLIKWLFLSFDYEYNKRDSNIPFESYTDNRFFGRITAQYDIAEQFQ